jgi:hypothetical protein
VFSTFFGGSAGGDVSITDLAVDAQGRLVLSGATELADLPITPGAPQTQLPAPPGGFIARMSADGSAIDYCTYIGCSVVTSVGVDSSSAIYAAGYVGTSAEGLPVTPGAFQTATGRPQ